MLNFKKIEKKWQKKWDRKHLFEADPEKRKKFFITFPYPYVNGAPHIGHSYSSFRCDFYARYKRMQGFNVLYPQGFHATGEPILGLQERLKKGDKTQIETMKEFGASERDIAKFRKDVKYIVRFWMKKWIEAFKLGGMSIDWRRTFVTTQMTPAYSRFIEWQYNTLRKKGYVVQGTHPVIWCPHDQSPTGDHDRLEGEGESPVDFTLLKFRFKDAFLPCGTLRPETIYGVTNIWVNPAVEYVKAKVDNEVWIISEEAAAKLKDQLKTVEIITKIKGEELLGKRCLEPLGNKEIPILPAAFVNPDNATGIVMSVPAHAPYDWVALKELIDKDELGLYNATKDELEPVSIIDSELGEAPAVKVSEKTGIKSLKDIQKLEEATSAVYKKEFHTGLLNEKCGAFAGMKVSDVKEYLIKNFVQAGIADIMWETTGKVVCRCTTKNHVKILENQWFLKFSDEKWKNAVRSHLKKMAIYPEEARNNFENTIDWLKDKACTRKSGMGTPLPWDPSWIVETLSDSTIYMAYYTIAKTINKRKIPAKKLTDEVFDYVFLGKGNPKDISKRAKLNPKLIKEMKHEFDHFYPVDFRGSGKDLIQNHLTFFLFHHAAIFPEAKWPRSIGVNGFVNVEGEKMSKSRGNIIPLHNLLKDYGADLVRINIVASSEGIDDADWRSENIKSYRSRIEFLFDLCKGIKKAGSKNISNVDSYLQSRMQKIIKNATENCEETRFRTAVHYALFETTNALRWYIRRSGDIRNANKKILRNALETTIKLITPATPHICEEMWQMLGGKGFAATAEWPVSDAAAESEESEKAEEMILSTLEDAEQIIKIAGIKPKKISLFIADEWKFRVYKKVLAGKNRPINDITKEIMETGAYGKATISFIQALYNKINELKPVIPRSRQFQVFGEAKQLLEKEFICSIEVIDASKSDNSKAKQATPQKLGIFVE
ncbi:MAG: leucine--tRNA ligase [Candidatus Aenigmarchaeota archaeon]|nr:leucine--tRNA ligase [Candidatus Aenigmarchaeota archaeon]